ncbi:beta-lactamase/transpeptidase-like protein [Eremomyces bilateralis CBS 781.70]|uniref:Beta-lactamase/transpeptidase-like protein n=1 Tax=Eremomyces bilateralis CBS 781.70 TaxID=1392243 RepID=A0A6G1GEZ7_9PEZI|nr:beta-lactamase/transpeptidase-like protein [Eremomyces bilateralis CBS 781.70]KAF1816481.1 beta-lactamase/transpeptidase-like protein [Eremomyces bilateralis CBS 781.70]
MEDLDSLLPKLTAKGANVVPGVVLSAVTKDGKSLYSKASGYVSPDPSAADISFENTFSLASCTKLVITIAALQCVERGQIALDDEVMNLLPELVTLEVMSPNQGPDTVDNQFLFRPRTNPITLRHFLTHTSGLDYDAMNPNLRMWRASRGELPTCFAGGSKETLLYSLLQEPGESSPTGLTHIFEPLGMTSTTFHLDVWDNVKKRLVSMSTRDPDGTVIPTQQILPGKVAEELGGAGLYSTVGDYKAMLVDLMQEEPTLLKKETDAAEVGLKKGTLFWGGAGNLSWFMNQERCVAGFYASQLLTFVPDTITGQLNLAFQRKISKLMG